LATENWLHSLQAGNKPIERQIVLPKAPNSRMDDKKMLGAGCVTVFIGVKAPLPEKHTQDPQNFSARPAR
jgi:hypothetical protein